MRLFDTRTQEVVPFVPAQTVRLYVCGITPYDAAHLGHAFVYASFDALIRYLECIGHTVHYVRNVTDLDDDTLRTAAKRDTHFQVLARGEAAQFDANLARLGLRPPAVEPFVTDNVDAMIPFIQGLIDRGVAYSLPDHRVYFNIDHPNYLAFSQLSKDEALEQFREKGGDPDAPDKKNTLDFLLWQPSENGQPSWPAPWGAGRPGWHIGCSVMIHEHIGATMDIHGGGSDLVFPHHESEILQAESLTGQHPLARVWMHCGMVALEGVKMSKSLGNLVFLGDLLNEYSADAIRAMLLNNHYRANWTYTTEVMDAAQARVHRWQRVVGDRTGGPITQAEIDGFNDPDLTEALAQLGDQLEDDLNTPGALAVLDELADTQRAKALFMCGRVLGFFQTLR
ncbi:cysteine--tRNA ligase [Stomatohabitans albus]|uniref:cysteine--tRNA ligase n=1 Tax=Stomatohabitans albus TaxID=3110766 RepID=UPI00300D9375